MRLRRLVNSARWLMHAPRRRLQRLLTLGRGFPFHALHRQAELEGDGSFEFADDVAIGRFSRIVVPRGQRLQLDAGVWIGEACEIGASPEIRIGARTSLQSRSQVLGEVSIGSGCVCAPGLYISSGLHHFADEPHMPVRVQDFRAGRRAELAASRPVNIGDDCWIGINVVVLRGVTIGRGCVIGANSVVRSDLPPYTVAAGSPARVVKARLDFSPPQAILASNDRHIPYFYAGFRQLGPSEATDDQCLRERGGWPARARFSLALNVRPGGEIALQVDSSQGGWLIHGNFQLKVAPGRQRLVMAANVGRWSLLDFDWRQPGDATNSLVVLSAEACMPVMADRT